MSDLAGPDIPLAGETTDGSPLADAQAEIASLTARLQTALAQNQALRAQNTALLQQLTGLSARVSTVEAALAAVRQRVEPLFAGYPVETIGEAIVQAVASSEVALSAVGDGQAFTVSDVECDVKGYVALSQDGTVISLRPVQVAAAGETLSVVRFRATKVPVSA